MDQRWPFSGPSIIPLLINAETPSRSQLWIGLWITFRRSLQTRWLSTITEPRYGLRGTNRPQASENRFPLLLKGGTHMWAKCGKDGRLPFPAQFSGEVRPTLRPPRRSRRARNIRYFFERTRSESRLEGLKAKKTFGFCNRATHNLWVLLDEARLIEKHLDEGTYDGWYEDHVENSTYKPLIDFLRDNEE